jgi:hypothetical protein
MSREGVTGLLVVASPLTVSRPAPLGALALKYRLPGIFGTKFEAEAGGLMSYGADVPDLYRRAALYMPVEQASKYQLVINLKTAKALGLTIPPTLLGSRRRGDRQMKAAVAWGYARSHCSCRAPIGQLQRLCRPLPTARLGS